MMMIVHNPTPPQMEVQMTDNELAPCPFCASTNWVLSLSSEDNWKSAVQCRSCFARGPLHRTDPAAKEDWNTRAALNDRKLLVDLVETIKDHLQPGYGDKVQTLKTLKTALAKVEEALKQNG